MQKTVWLYSALFLIAGVPLRVAAQQALTWQQVRSRFEARNPTLLADQLSDHQPHSYETTLPERERQVLLGILAGLTNRKIGENLGLSESSVKNVVQRLFSKAGVKTRTQLVRVALEGSLGRAIN